MPLIRLVDIEDARARRRNKKDVNLSKTEKMVSAAMGPACLPGRAGQALAYAFAYPRVSRASLRTGAATWLLKHDSLGWGVCQPCDLRKP